MEVLWLRLRTDFTNNYVMLIHTHPHITASQVPFPLTQVVPRSENGSRPKGASGRQSGDTTRAQGLDSAQLQASSSPASVRPCTSTASREAGSHAVACFHFLLWAFHGPRVLPQQPASGICGALIPGPRTPRGRELVQGSENVTSSPMSFFPILWAFNFP